jgi:hypothetical protein
MRTFNLGFASLFAVGAAYACYIIVTQIVRTLKTGEWRARGGIAYRSTSPKSFWFGVCLLSVFAAWIAVMATFLLIASFPNAYR